MLLTEQRNPASENIDLLDAEGILRRINEEDHKVPPAVGEQIPAIARAVDAIVSAVRRGGRIFYIGAGTSGRLGVLDASECPPTFGVSPDLVQGIIAGGEPALARASEASEDDASAGQSDLRKSGFLVGDVLIGIAASGRTPYVMGAVEHARGIGALTVGISCASRSNLSQAAEIAIEVVTGPEVIAGSTRMKAGTATKLVLNMISTAVMIRLGLVYSNLMVNVQPTNEKLRDRAIRIVAEAVGKSFGEAEALFEASGRAIKTAIVMGLLHVDRQVADSRIADAHGRLRDVLKG